MIKSKNRLLILCGFFMGLATYADAQERCGTVAYEKLRSQQHPGREGDARFEQWMRTKLSQSTLQAGRTQSTTYVIPVVVHVIHNGEAIGTDLNISDAQIQSQVDVLNKDYPRLNADASNTPAEFQGVAGSIDMQFVLAKQDPEGLPTTGIVRVQGTKTSWTLADNATFKAQSYWPAEDYLNIWVVKFADPSGIIGYAQLPVSNLPGLEGSSADRLTDGVAIDYRAFGSGFTNLYPQFNKGRTATHEIGHMFGLRHIWGDTGGCSSTDYCNDTPVQDTSTSGCPTQPSTSCGHDKMFQNYMDYTNDVCMNVFTQNQIDRMVVVLANSPRRASLLNSPGATAPVTVANDIGLRTIMSPTASACPGSTIPAVEVRNYGSNTVTSTRIELVVNGAVVQTTTFNINLAPLATQVLGFPAQSLSPAASDVYEFHVVTTNGGTDGNPANDSLSQTVAVAATTIVPLLEPFNALPSGWTVINPDGLKTWQNVSAPNASATNKAMYMDFYDYEGQGETDWVVTPVFDLSHDTATVLQFDRAYSGLSSSYNDRLRVLVSTNCDFSGAIEVFNKAGSALATTAATSNAYVPKSASEWKTETISLNQFLGHSTVQIAFVATNDYGNNLYLDNVRIATGEYTDLKLVALKSPSPVTCSSPVTPVVTVQNNGSVPVTTVAITVSINGGTTTTQTFYDLQLNTGIQQDFTLNNWTLLTGTNAISLSVLNPASLGDANPGDNALTINEVINASENTIPLRQNFDTQFPDWSLVSPLAQTNWTSVTTNKNISTEYAAFNNGVLGSTAWLVSPVLDFSQTARASMFFDLSYAKSVSGNDHLQILSSTDCGKTFPNVVFDQTGDQLAVGIPPSGTNTSNTSWKPLTNSDWKRQYVNLDDLVSNPQARLAFVVTNDHGNNLFIDNVEFFTDDDPNPVAIETPYSVYDNANTTFKITFNLPEPEPVHLQVFSVLGQVVIDNVLPETLNQTYSIDMTGQQAGMYLVRLQMGNQMGTAKVVVPY